MKKIFMILGMLVLLSSPVFAYEQFNANSQIVNSTSECISQIPDSTQSSCYGIGESNSIESILGCDDVCLCVVFGPIFLFCDPLCVFNHPCECQGLDCPAVPDAFSDCWSIENDGDSINIAMTNSSCSPLQNTQVIIQPTSAEGSGPVLTNVTATTSVYMGIEYQVVQGSASSLEAKMVLWDFESDVDMDFNSLSLTVDGAVHRDWIAFTLDPPDQLHSYVFLNGENVTNDSYINITEWKVWTVDADIGQPFAPSNSQLRELCNTTSDAVDEYHWSFGTGSFNVSINGTTETMLLTSRTASDWENSICTVNGGPWSIGTKCVVWFADDVVHVRGIREYPTYEYQEPSCSYFATSGTGYAQQVSGGQWFVKDAWFHFYDIHRTQTGYNQNVEKIGMITYADRIEYCGTELHCIDIEDPAIESGDHCGGTINNGQIDFSNYGNYTYLLSQTVIGNNYSFGNLVDDGCTDVSIYPTGGTQMQITGWFSGLTTGLMPYLNNLVVCDTNTYCSDDGFGQASIFRLGTNCVTTKLSECTWQGGFCNDEGTACVEGQAGLQCIDDYTLDNLDYLGYSIWDEPKDCTYGCNETTNWCNDNPSTGEPDLFCEVNSDCDDYCSELQDTLWTGGICSGGSCVYTVNEDCEYGCNPISDGACAIEPVLEKVIVPATGMILGWGESATKFFLAIVITLLSASVVTYFVSLKGGFGGGGIVFGITTIAGIILFTAIEDPWIDPVVMVILVILSGIIVAYQITKSMGSG